jgi:hypothetical protein
MMSTRPLARLAARLVRTCCITLPQKQIPPSLPLLWFKVFNRDVRLLTRKLSGCDCTIMHAHQSRRPMTDHIAAPPHFESQLCHSLRSPSRQEGGLDLLIETLRLYSDVWQVEMTPWETGHYVNYKYDQTACNRHIKR